MIILCDAASSTVTATPEPTAEPVTSTTTGTTDAILAELVTIRPPLVGIQYGMVVTCFLLAAVLGALIAQAMNWFKW